MSDSFSKVMELNSFTPIELNHYQYAIIEPQLCPDIFKWCYTYAIDNPIFEKIFEESPFQSIADGPILLQLTDMNPDFYQLIYDKSMHSPIGCFLTSSLTMNELLQQIRGRLTANTSYGESLFRFYEPRVLNALITVLNEEEKINIFSGIDNLIWWDKGWKHFSPPQHHEGKLRSQFQWVINDQQIDNINKFLAS